MDLGFTEGGRCGRRYSPVLMGIFALLVGGVFQSAQANTLCVNQNVKSGCYATIGAAVSAASSGDTIEVAPGTYPELVTIAQPLSLVGAGRQFTFIDATGLANAIYVNDASNVVVTGFTLENADYEGILVHDSSFVTIWGNRVMNNDKNLTPGESASCAGLTAVYPFETMEGDDCGEGIHILGSNHSSVYGNTVEYNAGGVLLSDEDDPADDNSIRDNIVRDNIYDCGVTLASHGPDGVFDNTVADNEVDGNGTFAPFGAGVGLFSPGGPTKNYNNVVVDNDLVGNGLAGVALHTHAPGTEVLQNELVIGNRFDRNGGDTNVNPNAPPDGIAVLVAGGTVSGLVFSQNTFQDESVGIAASIVPTTVSISAQLNEFEANSIGVDNLAAGTINATENWWGCRKGPGASPGCSTIGGGGVTSTPWLTAPLSHAGGN